MYSSCDSASSHHADPGPHRPRAPPLAGRAAPGGEEFAVTFGGQGPTAARHAARAGSARTLTPPLDAAGRGVRAPGGPGRRRSWPPRCPVRSSRSTGPPRRRARSRVDTSAPPWASPVSCSRQLDHARPARRRGARPRPDGARRRRRPLAGHHRRRRLRRSPRVLRREHHQRRRPDGDRRLIGAAATIVGRRAGLAPTARTPPCSPSAARRVPRRGRWIE